MCLAFLGSRKSLGLATGGRSEKIHACDFTTCPGPDPAVRRGKRSGLRAPIWVENNNPGVSQDDAQMIN
jgi:hypothetical protein